MLEGYRPLTGAFDECVDEAGSVREGWRDALAQWGSLTSEQRNARQQIAERYLRDNGVAHRIYGADHSTERPWPLCHLPLILQAKEWQTLEEGLIQRAQLLEKVLGDLYGAQTLVHDGHIPAPLIAGSKGFLRPLVGATCADQHHLHYIAVELGRGPDGRWWVLGDRTQSPSGAGYALENRLATSRAFGREAKALRVERLASFFQDFRQTLGQMTQSGSARVGLLTPGPFNETYYEQAFLARYLGFLLLEGGDLIMRDGALYVRTVRGLKRLDVLWRRVDAAYCDPLELRSDSRLGVPGLVDAVRTGGLTCINALGAGLMESRAFMAFLPKLAETLLGEPLKLPNIATWWLGDPSARDHIQDSGSQTVRLSAYGTSLPMDARHLAGGAASDGADFDPGDHVAQEVVRLSTIPTFNTQTGAPHPLLVPQPFSLRVFLARTQDGWQVMPGGFCRVADTQDTRALSMQDGSRSADVWVCADSPVSRVSLLPKPGTRDVRRVPGTLPARAGDNLFWLGRYCERAQLSIRLVRAYLARTQDGLDADDPLLCAIEEQLAAWDIKDPADEHVFEEALLPILETARQSASAIRDRFSPDAWLTLNRFVSATKGERFAAYSTVEKLDEALTMLAAFAGLVSENMIRLSGWRFLEIGRRVERAIGTCQLAGQFGFDEKTPGALNLLLETADSVMSYRQRYTVTSDAQTVLDLVVLDPNNPRSVAFQLQRIQQHIDEITDRIAFDQQSDLELLAFALWSSLHTLKADQISVDVLAKTIDSLISLSSALAYSFFSPAQSDGTIHL